MARDDPTEAVAGGVDRRPWREPWSPAPSGRPGRRRGRQVDL